MKIIYADDDANLAELNAVVRRYIDLVLLVQQPDLKGMMIPPLKADVILGSGQISLEEAARLADKAIQCCLADRSIQSCIERRCLPEGFCDHLCAYCYRHEDFVLVYFGWNQDEVKGTVGRFAKELGEMVVKGN
jgi:hypothetical protein